MTPVSAEMVTRRDDEYDASRGSRRALPDVGEGARRQRRGDALLHRVGGAAGPVGGQGRCRPASVSFSSRPFRSLSSSPPHVFDRCRDSVLPILRRSWGRHGHLSTWWVRPGGRQAPVISQEYLGRRGWPPRCAAAGWACRTGPGTDFGAVAAAWGMLDDLGVAASRPGCRPPRPGSRCPPGPTWRWRRCRLVAPCSRPRSRTGGDHRRGPVHRDPRRRAGSPPVLGRDACRHRGAAGADQPGDRREDRAVRGRGRVLRRPGHDHFATFIDTANGKAPIAQRGKASRTRDLRLVGLGLVVARDGGSR